MPREPFKLNRLAFTYLSIGLYAVSLIEVGFVTNRGAPTGLNILAMGWLGIFYRNPASFSWLANPLILSAWVLMVVRLPKSSGVAGILALIAAGSFLFCARTMMGEDRGFVSIDKFGVGYWLWLASIIASLTGTVIKPRTLPV